MNRHHSANAHANALLGHFRCETNPAQSGFRFLFFISHVGNEWINCKYRTTAEVTVTMAAYYKLSCRCLRTIFFIVNTRPGNIYLLVISSITNPNAEFFPFSSNHCPAAGAALLVRSSAQMLICLPSTSMTIF